MRARSVPQTSTDPERRSSRQDRNLSAAAVRTAWTMTTGYHGDDRPRERTLRDGRNRLGDRRQRVPKGKPLQKTQETSAFGVAALPVGWRGVRVPCRGLRRRLIYLDNGPPNSGRRRPFLKRLVYWPPYHSKYHSQRALRVGAGAAVERGVAERRGGERRRCVTEDVARSASHGGAAANNLGQDGAWARRGDGQVQRTLGAFDHRTEIRPHDQPQATQR